MSNLPSELPSSVGQVSPSWLADEEIRRTRALAFRAIKRRNSSNSSLSTVSEYDVPRHSPDRRGSAPEWSQVNRFLWSRRSSQTLPDYDWGNSSRRGSYPAIGLGSDTDQTYDIAKHLIEHQRITHRTVSGEFKWTDSTMTMDATTSLGASGRPLKFKVILLGDCGVGKSSFLQTLLNGKYTSSKPNTNLTTFCAVSTIPYFDQEVELHFSDTAGQERYRSITASYYRHAHGCLLFFNANCKLSFDHIESWLDDLNKYRKRENLAVVLVGLTHTHVHRHRQENKDGSTENISPGGTKSWSEYDNKYNDCKNRVVQRAQAEHLASNYCIPYMEADIQDNPNSVSETIYKLLELLMYKAVQKRQQSVSITPKHSYPRSRCCSYC